MRTDTLAWTLLAALLAWAGLAEAQTGRRSAVMTDTNGVIVLPANLDLPASGIATTGMVQSLEASLEGQIQSLETNTAAAIQGLENDKADYSNVWTRAESDARFAPTGVVERVDAIETNYFQKTGGTINGTVMIPHRLLAHRIGIDSGYLSTGGLNMYFGNSAGYSATGNNNMYIGMSAGLMSTNANHSMFIGRYAGKNALDKTYWMFIDHHVAYDPAFDPVDSSIAIDGSTATATLYLGRPEGSTRIRGNFYLPGGGLLTSDGTNLFFVTSDGSITNALTSN